MHSLNIVESALVLNKEMCLFFDSPLETLPFLRSWWRDGVDGRWGRKRKGPGIDKQNEKRLF